MNKIIKKFENFKNLSLNDKFIFNIVSKDQFEDTLLNLTTIDIEDSQVSYPKFNMDDRHHLFSGDEYDLYLIKKQELPISGPFEIAIESNDEQFIGFIRGNKKDEIISFNFIYIVEQYRKKGIGTDIYIKFLQQDFIIKSDSEITDNTYSIYYNLFNYEGYIPLIFNDGRVGLKK